MLPAGAGHVSAIALCLTIALSAFAEPGPPVQARRIKIIPIGDSITKSGHCAVPLDSSAQCPEGKLARSYRFHLAAALRAKDWEQDVEFVGSQHGPEVPGYDPDHEGHGGWTAHDALYGNPQDTVSGKLQEWEAAVDPDVALVLFGTNDIAAGRPLDSILADLSGIAATLRERNPAIVLVFGRLIPMTSQWGFALRADSLNDSLPALVAALDGPESPVRLAWLDGGMDRRSDYADSVHPNDEGCRKMGNAWMEALAPILRDRYRLPDSPDALLPTPPAGPRPGSGMRGRDVLGRRTFPKLLVSTLRWPEP